MNQTIPVELSQAERELVAYNEAMAAARRGDRTLHAKLWAVYAGICNERGPSVVRALEKARGLR